VQEWERVMKSQLPNSRKNGGYLESLQVKRGKKLGNVRLREEVEEQANKRRKVQEKVLMAADQKAKAETTQRVQIQDNQIQDIQHK